jgi:hypothetical protein
MWTISCVVVLGLEDVQTSLKLGDADLPVCWRMFSLETRGFV